MKVWKLNRFLFRVVLPLIFLLFSQNGWAKDVVSLTTEEQKVFSFPGQWKTAKNEDVTLSKYIGKKTILVLFYSTCSTICPMTVSSIKRVEESLKKKNIDVQILMISIDSSDLNSKQMLDFAKHQQVSGPNWHLLAGKPEQTSKLAALLGLGIGDKRVTTDLHRMHSQFLILLDGNGKIILKTPSLEPNISEILKSFSSLPKT